MGNSRRKMREASRSLAIAFNVGRVQEALYRVAAGDQLDTDEKALLTRLARFFMDASHGFEWSQATLRESAEENNLNDSRALRSLSLLLPVIRNHPKPHLETLRLLADVATKLVSGEAVDENQRTTFDVLLGDLASVAGSRLDDLVEDRDTTVSLSSLAE